MGHYKSNLRDLEFNLFEVFGADKALGRGPFEQMDADSARDVLREMERLCTEDLAESFVDADRHPPVYDPKTYSVTLPESFKKSYAAVMDGEWYRLSLPENLGGLGASPSIVWAASEMMLGANPAVFMYMAGGNFAAIIDRLGTPEQRKFAQTMVDRQWGATMVLTEPDAGSDVGAGRTVAHEQADGTWHIDGVKRFITSGDWDIPENIVHLVLARPDGAGPGTKGLSLFIVPKFHVTDWATGELGERNGAFVTNVEKKMGLKVSSTCEVTFGQHDVPAVGYLVGDVHDGIAQMFQVIEYARMMVGAKAISTLSTGYLNALEYAKQRVQGPDLTQMTDKAAPRVTITHHADVRLMLMKQKAWAEGMRALVLYTAHIQDQIALSESDGTDPKQANLLVRLNDLLLPVVKAYGSEKGYELLATSLQVLGGSGYLQDYPIEQYIRDAKIDTLYEGTTSIQGMDFFFRKIIRDKGKALNFIAREMREFTKGDSGGSLSAERELLSKAMDDLEGIVTTMVGTLMTTADERRNVYKVGLNTTRLLMASGDITVGWLLLRQAEVAEAALAGSPSARDKAFYEGKVAAAKWFAHNVLPILAGERALAESVTLDLMDLPEESF
jgi:alkylation response protein AidB-like acyl-CoA dehydrogenase